MAVVAALGSALCFAASTAFQHISAGRTAPSRGYGARALGSFVADTLRQPLWLLGMLVDVLAVVLHGLALHVSTLSVVQPLLVAGVVFTLPIHHRVLHTRVTRAEVGWSVVLGVGLAAFLVIASPGGGPTSREAGGQDGVDRLPAFLSGGIAVVAVGACLVLARGQRQTRAAAILGTAAGILFAGTAALLKVTADQVARGPLVPLTHPELYLLLVVGAAGLVLHQLAFQAGPLSASLPAFTVIDPLLSIALGVAVFDEALRPGAAAVLGEVVALLVVSAVAIRLTTIDDPRAGGPAGEGTGAPRRDTASPG